MNFIRSYRVPVIAGAIAVALGAASGAATAALWSDQDSATGTLHSGISAFVVRDATSSAPDMATNPADAGTYQVPSAVITSLKTNGKAAFGITVDGRQEGHRGMDYKVTGVTDSPFAKDVTAKVYRTDGSACTPTTTGTEVYSGALAGLTTPSATLVSSDYGVGNDAKANGRDNLCVVLGYAPDTYQNTATASGSYGDEWVQASDGWSAIITPEWGDTATTISFTHTTHRPTAN